MNFPPLLPALTVLSSFSATEADNVVRTAMDTGPAKARQRATSAPLRWSMGHPAYTKDQLKTFLDFFRNVTGHGALAFDMADPLMGGTMSCRMAAPPQWTAQGPDIFTVSVTLDILP